MDPDKPAVWADGTLRDASEMEWIHSPSADSIVLPFDDIPELFENIELLKSHYKELNRMRS